MNNQQNLDLIYNRAIEMEAEILKAAHSHAINFPEQKHELKCFQEALEGARMIRHNISAIHLKNVPDG